jgi:hypothetical protein
MTADRLVSLVIDGPEGPTRIDIGVQSHRLDAEDPMRLGDIMLWVDDSDPNDPRARHRIADDLAEVATALPGIRP